MSYEGYEGSYRELRDWVLVNQERIKIFELEVKDLQSKIINLEVELEEIKEK